MAPPDAMIDNFGAAAALNFFDVNAEDEGNHKPTTKKISTWELQAAENKLHKA